MQRLQAVSMAPSREATDTGGQWVDADAGLRPTERVGVLLLNLGGPETLADVQPFLYNLFADDSIIRLPPYGEISAHAARAATLVRLLHFLCAKLSMRHIGLSCERYSLQRRSLQWSPDQLIPMLGAPKPSEGSRTVGRSLTDKVIAGALLR